MCEVTGMVTHVGVTCRVTNVHGDMYDNVLPPEI